MANKKDPDYKLVDMLYRNYKSFRDFLRFPPSHRDIDPEYPACDLLLDIEAVDDIKRENNGQGYYYKVFTVASRCLLHNDRIYKYRAIIKMFPPRL